MELFMADMTLVDISDSCDNEFISICIWNMSVMLRLSPLFWSSRNFSLTSAVRFERVSNNAEPEIEPPELLTPDVGAEPTLEVGAELGPLVPGVAVSLDGLVASGVDVLLPGVGVVPDVVLEWDLDDVPEADEAVLDPESVPGVAAAKPLPRPKAAKPREPAMAVLAASFSRVLMVVISGFFRSIAGWSTGRVAKAMAPTNVRASIEICVS
jgi:hypothetical protein